ncbi:Reverse transcriptase zinc-binding domain [Macleaya cordata]|uniref:Reverse transcriptase zinc-binding domain n=1 Tax=Macleaya cordata TaxID=56857 RepID=A0A200QAG6_MACCD|nr:Reverse transcriptase zinc-binding domain [Macleaya cordata]
MAEFNKGVVYRIADGKRVRFWLDPWLTNDALLCEKFPNLYQACNSKDDLVADIAGENEDWNLRVSRNRMWDREIREAAELLHLLENFQFSQDPEDTRRWKWEKQGNFSVSSMYDGMMKFTEKGKINKRIWSTLWPAKVSFFIWCVTKKKILTQDMLKRKG